MECTIVDVLVTYVCSKSACIVQLTGKPETFALYAKLLTGQNDSALSREALRHMHRNSYVRFPSKECVVSDFPEDLRGREKLHIPQDIRTLREPKGAGKVAYFTPG